MANVDVDLQTAEGKPVSLASRIDRPTLLIVTRYYG